MVELSLMKKLDRKTIDYIYSGAFGIVIVAVLAFALLTVNEVSTNGVNAKLFLFLVFLTLSISKGLLISYSLIFHKDTKITFIKNIVFSALFLTLAVLVLVLYESGDTFFQVITATYLLSVIANRICMIFEKRNKFLTVYNIVISVIALILALLVMEASNSQGIGASALLLLLTVIMVISFVEVLGFAFAKIQLKGLLDIIRKTYVFEIIYGLIMLMVSFSFCFRVFEDEILTFMDGIWYSFAIVTTIGFGDFAAKTVIGRILSIILGLYGIVVVASITSVIVNYYNAIKDKKDNEEESEKKKPEETIKIEDDSGLEK